MIVGITGYAQHGKDTAAQVLVNEFGFVRVGFADALKELALAVNPIVSSNDGIAEYDVRLSDLIDGTPAARSLLWREESFGWEVAKKWPEVRRFLQVLGTEARKVLGEDVWVHALDNTLRERMPAANVVIPDVRFPNEANYVVNHRGGELWRVERRNPDGSEFDNGVGTEHESEWYVPELPASAALVGYSVDDLKAKGRFQAKWGTGL